MSTLPKILENHFGKRKAASLHPTAEAAQLSGLSVSTLKRWRLNGTGPAPSESITMGGLYVPLYTASDIRALKKHAGTQKPGPKPR